MAATHRPRPRLPQQEQRGSATSLGERALATSTRRRDGGFQVPRRRERRGNEQRTTTMLSFVILVYIANHGEYHVRFVPSDLANGDDTRYGTTAPTNDNPRTTHPRTCTTREQALPPTDDNSAPTNGNPAPTNNAATTHEHNNPPPMNREHPRTTCSRSIAPHPRTLHRTRTSPPPRNDNSAPTNDNPAPTNNAATSATDTITPHQ
ncbi:hypothetical protein K443DRAFT_8475 [Laccaria amethystina LaAM-08-1]|uniref:Uncharacterized protein n=1 Tax=Laccaria amethystina LaAM-08-1 TaxID=1095629 RepID=A0A0C9XTM7_9AGAR|nr:hypothetical protein K443DRAFT_8475 [Laccaria amethystina LaAM-08-1]